MHLKCNKSPNQLEILTNLLSSQKKEKATKSYQTMTMFKNLNEHALKSQLVLNRSLICRGTKTTFVSGWISTCCNDCCWVIFGIANCKPKIMQFTWPQVFANPLVNTRKSMPCLAHPASKTVGRLHTVILVRGNREYMLTAPVLLNSKVNYHPSLLFDCLTLRHASTCVECLDACVQAHIHVCRLQSKSSPSWPHYLKIGS